MSYQYFTRKIHKAMEVLRNVIWVNNWMFMDTHDAKATVLYRGIWSGVTLIAWKSVWLVAPASSPHP